VLVIFDCDGVLVDSEPLSNAALAEALCAIGLPFDVERTMAEFMGRSWASVARRIEALLGGPLPDGFRRDYEAARDAAFRERLRPVAGVAEAIDAVEAAGAATCVASSGDHAKMAFTLGLTGLAGRFDGRIFSAVDVPRGKPAPDLFLHAAGRMGFEPRRCVVVEDSPVGIAAAKAAGMRALGYAGRTDAAALAEADEVFADMVALPSLIALDCAPR
jgi:HAD superfamily hydrolase (TIGR01509 family)